MKMLRGYGCHRCCPKEFRGVQNLTGSHELDAMIRRTANRDMCDRLEDHLTKSGDSYGERTGYSGYSGYSGDD